MILKNARTRVVFVISSVLVMLLFSALLVAQRATSDDLLRALGNLAEVVHLVHSEYVDEVDLVDLREGLEAGIVESLDPWSAVVSSQDIDLFKALLDSPPPYGLILGLRVGTAAVRHTVPGSPAAEGGVEDWEIIEFIDGEPTRGQPLWKLRLDLLERQLDHESVRLTVVSREMEERREVDLDGDDWQAPAVSVEDRDGVRVVRVDNLAKGASRAVAEALPADLPVILDLRHLVWGTEAEALNTADLFLADGRLGRWQGRRAGERSIEARTEVAAGELPVVLVGHDTEGVGEILAAALQGGDAILVGGPTAGHAPHMMLLHEDELHLWLPVGLWLRADGTAINGNGVEPDEEVEAVSPEEEEGDPALEKALELARGSLAKAA